MMTEEAKTIYCHQCKNNECLSRYPQGMPDYCQAQKYGQIIEASKSQYRESETAKIHLATAKVLMRGGYDWSRIQQCIELAREMGATKVGLAVCVGLIREGREFARFMGRAGLEVVSVACMIGAVDAEETGIPKEWVTPLGISCNPIAQAEIMNQEGTQLNMIYGLCIGHDTIFIKHSKAPVTYVVVKDAVTGNNPSAVVFSPFHRMKLNAEYKKS
ncbi:MAG: DUF1847 domain-containing protein [Dehalococcoidia bacterium]|nr:DUF1847 domain-containing protein [Dehalococcoidia bacterium]